MRITNLQMRFGDKTVLDTINLTVRRGERVALLGSNGAGKTTLLNLINQGLSPTSGRIDYDDFDLSDRNCCYIMQHETLPDQLKADEALRLFALNRDNYQHGLDLTDRFGLRPALGKRYSALSGGEKRKLLVISSLQNRPRYFFLDEITTGLDYNSRDDLLTFLADALQQEEDSLFLVTHYIEEALRLCDRFLILKGGHISDDLSRDQLVEPDYSLVGLDGQGPRKVAKADVPDLFTSQFEHITHYERDFTRNLGELIAD